MRRPVADCLPVSDGQRRVRLRRFNLGPRRIMADKKTIYRCYGCPAKISSRWLCETCTAFARSMMGRLIQVRAGADAAFDEAFKNSPCVRVGPNCDLAFGFVTAMSLDSFLPPHVVINENQGALIDWVDILGPLPRAKQFGGRTRAQSC